MWVVFQNYILIAKFGGANTQTVKESSYFCQSPKIIQDSQSNLNSACLLRIHFAPGTELRILHVPYYLIPTTT